MKLQITMKLRIVCAVMGLALMYQFYQAMFNPTPSKRAVKNMVMAYLKAAAKLDDAATRQFFDKGNIIWTNGDGQYSMDMVMDCKQLAASGWHLNPRKTVFKAVEVDGPKRTGFINCHVTIDVVYEDENQSVFLKKSNFDFNIAAKPNDPLRFHTVLPITEGRLLRRPPNWYPHD